MVAMERILSLRKDFFLLLQIQVDVKWYEMMVETVEHLLFSYHMARNCVPPNRHRSYSAEEKKIFNFMTHHKNR
jgi:hypothetical protein